jgi:hypothetical protein
MLGIYLVLCSLADVQDEMAASVDETLLLSIHVLGVAISTLRETFIVNHTRRAQMLVSRWGLRPFVQWMGEHKLVHFVKQNYQELENHPQDT